MAEVVEVRADKEELAKLLGAYIQSGNLNFLLGSGASLPAVPVAGNIETEIDALLGANQEAAANLKCLDFMATIEEVHASISADPPVADVASTLKGYSDLVSVVDRILFARKNVLLPRQANVFTTNYDMFIEYAAGGLPGLVLNDGFDRTWALGAGFPFAPERYFDRTYRSGSIYVHQTEVPSINLVKLHGSLSWRHSAVDIVFDAAPLPALNANQRADPAAVAAYLQKRVLILPNLRKFHSTLIDRIYYDLLRLFANAMDRGNAVLFSFGFSFADEHILDITKRALRNPTAQLIIVSFDSDSAPIYQSKFAKHRNVTILAPAVGTTLGIGEFNRLLESVLPETGSHHAT